MATQMRLQVCFVDHGSKTAGWLDYEPFAGVPPTDTVEDVYNVVRALKLPDGMDAVRIYTSRGVWTFQYHPTYGCVPRLIEDNGEIRGVWPTNAEVGGQWTVCHVLPDGHYTELVYVEACHNYQMGDSDSPSQRTVNVPAGFIGKYMTTVQEWNWFAQATGCPVKPTVAFKQSGERVDITHHPVTRVSYFDARAYAEWAGLGIPTEEQWEHAARGRDGRKFPWGNEPPNDELCHSSVQSQKELTDDVRARPKGVSPYGAYDMAGNAWEWTSTVHK